MDEQELAEESRLFEEAEQRSKALEHLELQRQKRKDWSAALRRKFPEEADLLERAWAAGFFDGEGHVNNSDLEGGTFECQVEQVEVVNLERFAEAVGGVGKIRPTAQRSAKHQLKSRWSVSSQPNLSAVYDAIGPFLSPDKQRGFARALSVPTATALRHGKALAPNSITVVAEKPTVTEDGD